MKNNSEERTAIENIELYIPDFYLSIKMLAKERGVSFEELSKELGLDKMVIPNGRRDSVTMSTNRSHGIAEENPKAAVELVRPEEDLEGSAMVDKNDYSLYFDENVPIFEALYCNPNG